MKIIAHIDIDAFFASVEQRDNPSLRSKPVIISSDPKKSQRGVVSTCSYEARKFGVHSAMPSIQALKLCPNGIFIPPRMNYYLKESKKFITILKNYSPKVQQISIDEAFLDLSHTQFLNGTPLQTGKKIKKQVNNQLGLNISIGIAPNMSVAKIASDYCKPNGLLEIKNDELLTFLRPLSIGKIWGIGPKTQKILQDKNIKTIGQLAQVNKREIYNLLGKNGIHIYQLANGIDKRELELKKEIKSLGHEETFQKDIINYNDVNKNLLEISQKISRRLRLNKVRGKTINLKIKFSDFQIISKSKTIKQATNFSNKIFDICQKLFYNLETNKKPIRLIGVSVSNFRNNSNQQSLFQNQNKNDKEEKIYQAIDLIKSKFGEESIRFNLKNSKNNVLDKIKNKNCN